MTARPAIAVGRSIDGQDGNGRWPKPSAAGHFGHMAAAIWPGFLGPATSPTKHPRIITLFFSFHKFGRSPIYSFQWRAASQYWVLWSCEVIPGDRVWGVWGRVSVQV